MISVRFALLTAVLTVGCANNPPSVPTVVGPTRCRPGDTVSFSLVAVDAEGDSVSYFLQWDAGRSSDWTGWYKPGESALVPVQFADSGNYRVVAKARDTRLAESGWSDTGNVLVRDFGPFLPHRPAGPDTAAVGDSVSFLASGGHPLREFIAFQFRWGDSLGTWSGFAPPDSPVRVRHAFQAGGWAEVWCRAKDRGERQSGWSTTDSVWVTNALGPR